MTRALPSNHAVAGSPEVAQRQKSFIFAQIAAGKLDFLKEFESMKDSSSDGDVLSHFLPFLTRVGGQNPSMTRSSPANSHLQTVKRLLVQRDQANLSHEYVAIVRALSIDQVVAFMQRSTSNNQLGNDSNNESSLPLYRQFENGDQCERALIVLSEILHCQKRHHWHIARTNELFSNRIYQPDMACILINTLANSSLCQEDHQDHSSVHSDAPPVHSLTLLSVVRFCLHIPSGVALLDALVSNDPSCLGPVVDSIIEVLMDEGGSFPPPSATNQNHNQPQAQTPTPSKQAQLQQQQSTQTGQESLLMIPHFVYFQAHAAVVQFCENNECLVSWLVNKLMDQSACAKPAQQLLYAIALDLTLRQWFIWSAAKDPKEMGNVTKMTANYNRENVVFVNSLLSCFVTNSNHFEQFWNLIRGGLRVTTTNNNNSNSNCDFSNQDNHKIDSNHLQKLLPQGTRPFAFAARKQSGALPRKEAQRIYEMHIQSLMHLLRHLLLQHVMDFLDAKSMSSSSIQLQVVNHMQNVFKTYAMLLGIAQMQVSEFESTRLFHAIEQFGMLLKQQHQHDSKQRKTSTKTSESSPHARKVTIAFVLSSFLCAQQVALLNKYTSTQQRDEMGKLLVSNAQQALYTLYSTKSASSFFICAALLLYTKPSLIVDFFASILDLPICIPVESFQVFGEVVLKPILTESVMTRELMNLAPINDLRANPQDLLTDMTLRAAMALFYEKSFIRHQMNPGEWLFAQIVKAQVPIHPLFAPLIVEFVENYAIAFEYPISKRPFQLCVVPFGSIQVLKAFEAPCLLERFPINWKAQTSRSVTSKWAIASVLLLYVLHFNQRMRQGMHSGKITREVIDKVHPRLVPYDLVSLPVRKMVAEMAQFAGSNEPFEFVYPSILKLVTEEMPYEINKQIQLELTASVLPSPWCPVASVASIKKRFRFAIAARASTEQSDAFKPSATMVNWLEVTFLLEELVDAPWEVLIKHLDFVLCEILPVAVFDADEDFDPQQKHEQQLCVAHPEICALLDPLWKRLELEHPRWLHFAVKLLQVLKGRDVSAAIVDVHELVEEPFRVVNEVSSFVFSHESLARVVMQIMLELREVSVQQITKRSSVDSHCLQQLLMQDCLIVHALLKRVEPLVAIQDDQSGGLLHTKHTKQFQTTLSREVQSELFNAVNRIVSGPNVGVLQAIHVQGYASCLIDLMVDQVPTMQVFADTLEAEFIDQLNDQDLLTNLHENLRENRWLFRVQVVCRLLRKYLGNSSSSRNLLRHLLFKINVLISCCDSTAALPMESLLSVSNSSSSLSSSCTTSSSTSSSTTTSGSSKRDKQRTSGGGSSSSSSVTTSSSSTSQKNKSTKSTRANSSSAVTASASASLTASGLPRGFVLDEPSRIQVIQLLHRMLELVIETVEGNAEWLSEVLQFVTRLKTRQHDNQRVGGSVTGREGTKDTDDTLSLDQVLVNMTDLVLQQL